MDLGPLITAGGGGAPGRDVADGWPVRLAVMRLEYDSAPMQWPVPPPNGRPIFGVAAPDELLEPLVRGGSTIGGVRGIGVGPMASVAEGREAILAAARRAGADAVLVYTVESHGGRTFVTGVLTVVTLGLLPDVIAHADASADCVILDTTSGGVIRRFDADAHAWQPANIYTTCKAQPQTVARAERYLDAAIIEQLLAQPPGTRKPGIDTAHDRSIPTPSGVKYETTVVE